MAYITVEQYVTRYGARETTLLTNETAGPGGTYDTAKVAAEIDNATDEVDGYISRRYSVPLASPPPIVRGWVEAIARLKLAEATGRVPQAIKDAADRVTRQLEQLAASKMDLPIEPGSPPVVENSSGSPMSSNDAEAPIFTRGAMADFLGTFTGASDCTPNWIRGR
jgi:phage gp36-like protein